MNNKIVQLTCPACRTSKNMVKTLIKSTARDIFAAALRSKSRLAQMTFMSDARNLRTSWLVRHRSCTQRRIDRPSREREGRRGPSYGSEEDARGRITHARCCRRRHTMRYIEAYHDVFVWLCLGFPMMMNHFITADLMVEQSSIYFCIWLPSQTRT